MIIENYKFDRMFRPWFSLLDTEDIDAKEILNTTGRICLISPGNYTFFIAQADTEGSSVVPLMLKTRSNTYDIDHYLPRQGEPERNAQICKVTNVVIEKSGDMQIELTIVFFPGIADEWGDLHIGIDEWIIETAERNNIFFKDINGSKADGLGVLLREKCTINTGSGSYFLIRSGGAVVKDVEKPTGKKKIIEGSSEKENSAHTPQTVSAAPPAFAIYGEGIILPIEKREKTGGEEYFAATKIVFRDAISGEGGFKLAHANLVFFDWTKGGEKISLMQQGKIQKFSEFPHCYLKLWDDYTRMEGNAMLKEAREFGSCRYDKIYPAESGKGWKIFMAGASFPVGIEKSQSVEFVDELPPYLSDQNLDWDIYQELMKGSTKQVRNSFGSIKQFDKVENYITVEMDDEPPPGKYMVLSIHGNKTQITRRQNARDAILQCRSANPFLGLLIEEGAELPKSPGRVMYYEPLTQFIREKIFQGRDIRKAQCKAIETALNTPDIALIKGPPGTGKTTVVAAILERLNEIYGGTGVSSGRILISSSQHDAVENLAERIRINSIPAIKFGKKHSDTFEQILEDWRKKFADSIEKAHQNIAQSRWCENIQAAFDVYLSSPSAAQAAGLLQNIQSLPHEILTPDIHVKIKVIQAELDDENKPGDTEVIRRIRALRVTETSFSDDGSEQAHNLLDILETELNENERQTLLSAAAWRPETSDFSFLKDLRELKRDLLQRFTPKPHYRIEKPRADILELISIVNNRLENVRDFADKREMALAGFWNELKNNPEGINRALEDYSVVYASTVQFAGSDKMAKVKSKDKSTTDSLKRVSYDTVVIDEAARVSPPDLLIALSQAEKRIILVGDHRQLPQLVEDDLINKAVEGEEVVDAEKIRRVYHESMFAYLERRLKELYKNDNIRRIARLDAQYRMHHFLGDFVSEHFYYRNKGDEYDFDERYESPLKDTALFDHNLPETGNRPAAWINVPFSRGGHISDSSKSSYRSSEAEIIAEKLAKWINIPGSDGKFFTFGVISFYTAQKNELNEKLCLKGLCIKDADGMIHVKKDYAKRILVGTVDAFQGREFDIVLLSLVRSRDVQGKKITEKLKIGSFGHLLSENRLCVSMSRQKRLLAVVGDVALMQSDLAREAVPALYDFCKICMNGKDGIML
jgi:hypothetical protein